MKNNFKTLREYIKEIISQPETQEEASVAASIAGYSLPLGMTNKLQKTNDKVTDEIVWKSYAKSFGDAKKI
jgi:hypothetical protein